MREGSLDHTAFAYTVWLSEVCTHPEILVSGRSLPEMGAMLNDMAAMVGNHGHVLEPGMQLDLEERRVLLATVPRPWEIAVTASRFYGRWIGLILSVYAATRVP